MGKPSALVALACLGLTLAAPLSSAQTAPAPTDEEVVVRGVATRDALQAFVGQMAAASRTQNQLARWDRKICPGIAGLRTRYAQFINDRMAQRAYDVGLDVGEPGCKANILILVSNDPDAYARELADDHPSAMGIFGDEGRNTLGRRALARFVGSDAPVRWWHVSNTVDRDTGERAYMVANRSPSLMRRSTRQDFGAAFIIVDANRLSAINFDWGALADYLAMAALAQLDAEADIENYPTILNLFAARSTVRALTDWDVAYLRGLYGATRDAVSTGRQQGDIARSMGRDLNAPAPQN